MLVFLLLSLLLLLLLLNILIIIIIIIVIIVIIIIHSQARLREAVLAERSKGDSALQEARASC